MNATQKKETVFLLLWQLKKNKQKNKPVFMSLMYFFPLKKLKSLLRCDYVNTDLWIFKSKRKQNKTTTTDFIFIYFLFNRNRFMPLMSDQCLHDICERINEQMIRFVKWSRNLLPVKARWQLKLDKNTTITRMQTSYLVSEIFLFVCSLCSQITSHVVV